MSGAAIKNDHDEEKASLIRNKDASPSPLESKKTKDNIPATTIEVGIYMTVFFFGMIFHEIAIEGASENFHDLECLAAALTLFQFGTCFLLPLIVSKGKALETFPRSFKALLPYVGLSILVFGATALATQSLRYVSYPTKIVFKSAKLIPTMVVSTILRTGSKYRAVDYLAAGLLCAGAAGYSYGTEGTDGQHNSTIGIVILTISIICDALVPNIQKRIMCPVQKVHGDSAAATKGLSAAALMVNTNAVGFSVLLFVMSVSGMVGATVTAAMERPVLLVYLFGVGICLAMAVLAYTRLIQLSGPVVAVATATLRKVVTVLLSYILYPKPLLPVHAFSGLLVLVGVLLSTFCRRR
uniref:Sugar phosphate transporter domain-containing protein n=1 Tax=Helicotheca tamesis TaxID=374047 RepID=A0A7S2MJ67_9STRA|mmetsp:Transcript_16866/g.23111  ORF Transcript_16866/g.23111 Transcript_16866/m.23111 type:complete len:354 (+) Transcript_16866:39-1100(+)